MSDRPERTRVEAARRADEPAQMAERPLMVLNLMAHKRADSDLIVAAHHRYTDPERELIVLTKDDDPERLLDAGHIEVTGSSDMVGDVDYVERWCAGLEAAARAGIPVLGVCFGHQMLGVHFGARLASWPKGRVGVVDVTFDAEGPFEAGTVPVIATHRDYIQDLGPTLVEVGRGGFGGVQAWAHPDLPIWGIQTHPEADAALTRAMEGDDVAKVPDAALETPDAKHILRRFGAL